ncbi:Two-component response regulator ARR2 [Linum perenne]
MMMNTQYSEGASSSKPNTSHFNIKIMVVDEDPACLIIVTKLFKQCKESEVMSADSDERMMLQTLEDGAAMYLVKPINKDDLKNVLQYAYSTTNEAKFTNDDDQESESDDAKSASSVNNFNTKSQPKAIAKRGRKRAKKHDKGEDECESRRAKKKNKTKVVWTSSLHNQFLDAVNFYGQESK